MTMSFNFDKLRTPQFIFVIYVLISSLLIMIFRFIFPGSEAPLEIYSRSWRFIQGALELFNLFPALAFSALVIPFGLASFEESYQSFSDMFFRRLFSSVLVAIIAAVIYAFIFFLAYPMVKNNEENMRFSGELYQLAKNSAYQSKEDGDWHEAAQFLGICDRIWFNSRELADLKLEIAVNLERQASSESEDRSRAREELDREWRSADLSPLSDETRPVDSTQALAMAETAFNEKRYFDAHWLAVLGGRLARERSPEAANAARLSSEAWNMITSQAPNLREERFYELFNIKLSGYQAMDAGDWIRAFYIFQELLTHTPDDPDVKNFLAASERGAKEYAFFIDEMELSLGEILTGPVFSLPNGQGRAVLRFSSLTTASDVAYGMGFECMKFDEDLNPRESVTARYVKLLPFTLNEKPQVLALTHALDRSNEDNSYKGEWLLGDETPGGIILDVSYEDFLLISSVRRGLSNLQVDELFTASERLSGVGYVYQIFQAEILNRLGSALFFLPMAVFVIIIAWRYRAKARPRYLFILLLPVLPVVFNGFAFLYRAIFNTVGIWLVLSVGFAASIVVYIVIVAVTLFVSLVVLAAQHS
jgi:hypothetical protein